MLLYDNGNNWRMIFQRAGGIVYRVDVVGCGLVLATISALLSFSFEQGYVQRIVMEHVYGAQALGTVVTFAVVFRTNLAWGRYWEAISQVHVMYSKFADVYAQVLAFSSCSIDVTMKLQTSQADTKVDRIQTMEENILHNISLLSAFAADRLTHGDLSRMEYLVQTGQAKSIIKRDELLWDERLAAHTYPELEVTDFGALRLTRLQEERPQKRCTNEFTKSIYTVQGLPPEDMQQVINESNDRTSIFSYEVQRDIAAIGKELEIAPPIQSRMFQELSNGMVGFSHAMKIADVPFPFPFAQTLSLVLIFFSLSIPIVIAIFTANVYIAPIVTFLLFEGLWGTNELAKDLETPFGQSVNDIPMSDFHGRFMDACKDMHMANNVRIRRMIRQRDERLAELAEEQERKYTEEKESGDAKASDILRVKDDTGSIPPARAMPLQVSDAHLKQKLPAYSQKDTIDSVSEAQLVLLNARMEHHLQKISADMEHMSEQIVKTLQCRPMSATGDREPSSKFEFGKKEGVSSIGSSGECILQAEEIAELVTYMREPTTTSVRSV
eukprot:TRINITY_DN11022_c0_g1_i4.p1 TRINITY_DN11022_c0_g1~~TRINITY_DN11022_c0_g1_i4.p1  ORF type:complete len:553 (+),score=78.26 TRINITY_DN11022_c0_g1_i4:57-1715(+)